MAPNVPGLLHFGGHQDLFECGFLILGGTYYFHFLSMIVSSSMTWVKFSGSLPFGQDVTKIMASYCCLREELTSIELNILGESSFQP